MNTRKALKNNSIDIRLSDENKGWFKFDNRNLTEVFLIFELTY